LPAFKGRGPTRQYAASPTLVGESRVVVPVGDYDLARCKRRRDHLADQLAARCHEEVHLRLRVEREPGVKDDLADALTQLGAARLADDNRIVRAEPFTQHLDLRRLAGPLGALEGDEEASTHMRGEV